MFHKYCKYCRRNTLRNQKGECLECIVRLQNENKDLECIARLQNENKEKKAIQNT